MEDGQIVDLYIQRDSAAIDESDRKYGIRLQNTAFRILYSQEDSEECLNDTYYAAWNSIPPTVPRSLGAYLLSTIRNISISKLRKRCADRRGKGEYALAYDELSEMLQDDSDPEAEIEIRELAEALNRFLAGLKPEDRKLFLRRYWLLEPVREIAELSGMTESRVKSSLFRTRKALKTYLTGEGYL